MKIAIVSGAGNGMGKEFAKKLDKENLDEIWAIAMHIEGLNELETQIKTPVKKFALDLTNRQSLEIIKQQLETEKPEILWLINAAGYAKFNSWENIKTETSLNMVDLNIKAVIVLTDLSIPYMVKGSRIVDIASIAGFQPVPYINVYSATKAFILSYARGLSYELKHLGISVTCVCPYWTKTKFFDRAIMGDEKIIKKFIVMYDAEKVISRAYKDSLKRKRLSLYGFISKFQIFLTKILPASLVCKIWLKQQKLTKYGEK